MGAIIKFLIISAVFLINYVKCGPSPYATNYPYNSYGYDGEDSEGAGGMSAYLRNRLLDKGNDLKSAMDVSKFYNSDNESRGRDIMNERYGASTDTKKHTLGEDFNNDKSHNRKTIKSGFKNSYHKDESGSNSSYYEDSDDHGGKLVYNKLHHHGGDVADSKYNEGIRDGVHRDKYDDRYSGYDSRGSHDREHYLAENKGNERDYRDNYNRGHDQRYTFDDRNDRYRPRDGYGSYRGDEQFYRPSSFNRNDYPRPMPSSLPPLSRRDKPLDDDYLSRHRITIYEDPRELIDPRDDRRRDDFRANPSLPPPILDVRPSPLRYHGYEDERRSDVMRYRSSGGY